MRPAEQRGREGRERRCFVVVVVRKTFHYFLHEPPQKHRFKCPAAIRGRGRDPVFVSFDFLEIGSREAVDILLHRLTQDNGRTHCSMKMAKTSKTTLSLPWKLK